MTEIYSPAVLEGRSLKSRCVSRAGFSPKALGENLSLPRLASGWLHHSGVCFHPHVALSSSVSVFQISLSLSLTKTPITGCRS